MSNHLEIIHLEEHDPALNMPYAPAIKARAGTPVYLAGVTAAPIYHHHPHIPAEFDAIPRDPAEQTRLAMENLRRLLRAAGGDLCDLVQVIRFITDLERNQDAVNRVMAEYLGDHRPTSTTVEVTRLATDPRLIVELSAIAVVPS